MKEPVPDRARWQRIKRLVVDAAARPPVERARFLADACRDDAAMRDEVVALIASQEQASDFLERHPPVGSALADIGYPSPARAPHFTAGERIGPYEIVESIGAGGMGEVYRARDPRLHRDVALKVLPPSLVSDPVRRERFVQEARAASALEHPHIAVVHEIDEIDGVTFIAMELVRGEPLSALIARGSLSAARALDLAIEIAEGLARAHETAIVHRDLKPANVMVTAEGHAKIIDFGLAKLTGPIADSIAVTLAGPATESGMVLGTASYMSPEQARGDKVDYRTDVFSFGIVLYEMLTGAPPFRGRTAIDTMHAILHDAVPALPLISVVTDDLQRIVEKCLAKEPGDRYQGMRDVVVDLRTTRRRLDSSQVRAGAVIVTRKHPALMAGAVLGLTVVAIAGGIILYRATTESAPTSSPVEYVQITNFTDAAMAPSLSPDGRMVAFKRGTNTAQAGAVDDFLGAGQIYVKLLPGGDAVQLTNAPGSKYAPVFTPDGSRVAYTQLASVGNSLSWDTWTVPVLGGAPTRLLPNASGLAWLAPGRVLFSEIRGGLHMGIVTATETRAESRAIYFPVLDLGMAHYSYASPDRQSILVVEMANTHAFDAPCRLVPFDGRSAGRSVGPNGTCLSAAWSPDGRWMYFAADVGGGVHLWRQRFPNGTPEQITSGATEEQGIAVAPDGRSLITSIGQRLSAIWIHDPHGERAITSEGYASAPRLSRDGSRAFYLDSTSPAFSVAGPAPPGELRVVDIASGRTESVLPGVPVADYDMSPDGSTVAFTTLHPDGQSDVSIAPIDHRVPPRSIASSADQVSFSDDETVFFRAKDGKLNFLDRMHTDGSGRERLSTTPILIKYGVSPDGAWVAAAVPVTSDDKRTSGTVAVPMATVAIPVHGGATQRICGETCPSKWSADGKFFSVGMNGTLVIPVPAGQSLPRLDAAGISSNDGAHTIAGARAIPRKDLSFGSDPSIYLFRRTELHANLFRIPLP